MAERFLLLNVLDRNSFEDCNIKGSINVPIKFLKEFSQNIPKDTEIVVYCAQYSCPKSREAWHVLHDLGFTNVLAYEGGIKEWKSFSYPTTGPCRAEYLKGDNKSVAKSEGDSQVQTITAEELLQKLQ